MPKFMLILQEKPGTYAKMSPDEMQQAMERYKTWIDGLHAAGRYVASDKLMFEGGKVATLTNGRVSVVDGPYSEAKEVVGGYFIIRAAGYDEAVDVARDCPFLHAGSIAIRQVDPMGRGEE